MKHPMNGRSLLLGWGAAGLAIMLAGPGAAHTRAGETAPASPVLECFATSDLVRVFEDGYEQGEVRPTNNSLFGLRSVIFRRPAKVYLNQRSSFRGPPLPDLRHPNQEGDFGHSLGAS